MMIVCKICGQEIDETQKDTFLTDFNMCQFCAVKYKELMSGITRYQQITTLN